MRGTVIQISTSQGGVPKYPIPEAFATRNGLEGDQQKHTKFHGGPFKALLLVSAENLQTLVEQGWALFPGALGENLTIQGIDFQWIRPGQRFRVGDALVEITQPRQPCSQLTPYGEGIQKALYDSSIKKGLTDSPLYGLSGFYASVIREGLIRTHDPIELLEEFA